ncbi:MAG: hypothetical protein DRQ35_01750 [Gammaproteobacteria bacterium]|nr:MAG: hypothetical protein DRQ35_01750 [Gammaproteobacteria bacterium]
MDIKRLFIPRGGFRRVFSVIRMISLMIGAAIASVYFMTDGNVSASLLLASVAYIVFRLAQIRGYIK